MESAQVIAMRNWCNVRLIRHWPAVVPKRDCCITVIEEANTRGLAYQAYLEQSGIQSSMSRKGNCWDNSAMESFFGTLKDECMGEAIYSSHDEAR